MNEQHRDLPDDAPGEDLATASARTLGDVVAQMAARCDKCSTADETVSAGAVEWDALEADPVASMAAQSVIVTSRHLSQRSLRDFLA